MGPSEKVNLTRDCEVVEIPSGKKYRLPAGTPVKIIQALGGSFTVVTEGGGMVQIAEKDANALGKEVVSKTSPETSEQTSWDAPEVEKRIWAQLRACFDPEIPVNIVDLGLVYLCRVTPIPEGGYKAEVHMTLTAPGCGMGEVLRSDAQGKLLHVPGVKQADVQLVWEPHWDPSRMSEAAKLQLGML